MTLGESIPPLQLSMESARRGVQVRPRPQVIVTRARYCLAASPHEIKPLSNRRTALYASQTKTHTAVICSAGARAKNAVSSSK